MNFFFHWILFENFRSISGRCQRGGNASNICTVLRQLDRACEFIGSLSEAQTFSFLIDDCHERGIRIDHCVKHATKFAPFSSVILNESTGSRTIIHSNLNMPILKADEFTKIPYERYKWIHFEVSQSMAMRWWWAGATHSKVHFRFKIWFIYEIFLFFDLIYFFFIFLFFFGLGS